MEHIEFPNSERTASGLEIPRHGRNGFIPAFNILYDRIKTKNLEPLFGPQLVEIGSQRDWEMGNGCSTNLLAWFCRNYRAWLVTVDINTKFVCDLICAGEQHSGEFEYKIKVPESGGTMNNYVNNACCVQMDGVQYMKNPIRIFEPGVIDFLYLDAWDYGPSEEEKRISRNEHLRCFMFAEEHLADDALVLIDDVMDHETYEGKGKYLIPYLLDNNYELIHKDYQYLFQRRKNV